MVASRHSGLTFENYLQNFAFGMSGKIRLHIFPGHDETLIVSTE